MRVTSLPLALIAAVAAAGTSATAQTTVPIPAVADSADYAKILSGAYSADEPGGATLVAAGGEIVFLGATGMADLELGVRLTPDMVFEIGSITKQFTAAAIMLLAEEGKLSVSDPMSRHLPDFPAHGDDVTIEHLLTHTSGIVSYTGIPGYMATQIRNDLTVQELIDVFKDLPVEFAPGERFAYNNSGYILLGAIVEAASGMSYEDFVRTRIFEPLGMQDAYYGCSDCIIARRAAGYQGGPDGYTNQRYLSFTQPYAAGALMMTVEDLHRWSLALFGGKVVSAESLELMTTPFILNDGEATGYGYGLVIDDVRGRPAVRHGGGIFGFVTDALYLPDSDVFVAVFSNNAGGETNPGTIATKLAALAVGEPFPEFEQIALDEDVLRRYVGVYELRPGFDLTILLDGDQLIAQATGQRSRPIHPTAETEFVAEGIDARLSFTVEADGTVSALTLFQGGRETTALRKPQTD